jgi:hypothetical protein
MGHIRRNTAKIATVAEARSRKRATYEEMAEMPPEQRQNPASEPCQNPFGKMMRNQVVGWSGQVRICDPPGLVSPPATPNRRSGLSPGPTWDVPAKAEFA